MTGIVLLHIHCSASKSHKLYLIEAVIINYVSGSVTLKRRSSREVRLYQYMIVRCRYWLLVSDSAHTLPPVYYGAGNHTLNAVRYAERILDHDKDVGAILRTMTETGCVPIETVEYREERRECHLYSRLCLDLFLCLATFMRKSCS